MFKIYTVDNARQSIPPTHMYPVGTAAAVKVGETLVLNAQGALELCGATAKPTFIALQDAEAKAGACAVGRITPDTIFKVTLSTFTGPNVVAGKKLKIAGTGLEIDSSATDGKALIVDTLGATKVGDEILVSFTD